MEDILVQAALSDQVGKAATFHRYDTSPENDSPMSFVLSYAQQDVAARIDLYWVEGGIPELFCMQGFESKPIVYNTRYIELSYLVRGLFRDGLDEVREELVERTLLRVMAELAVRYGDTEWAIRAFLQSIVGQSFFMLDSPGAALQQLELEPMGESYTATWFFGLAHEIGHLHAGQSSVSTLDYFSKDQLKEALAICINMFPMPEDVRKKALENAASGDPTFPLSFTRLADEAYADLFAVFLISRVTQKMMQRSGLQFDITQYIAETTLSLALVSLLERCKRMALIASSRGLDNQQKDDLLFQPVTYAVRRLLIRPQFDSLVAKTLFHTIAPSADQHRQSVDLVNRIETQLQTDLDQVEKGLARAIRFALFPSERSSNLMRRFAQQVMDEPSGITRVHAKQFCTLVESFHGDIESANAVRRIASAKRG